MKPVYLPFTAQRHLASAHPIARFAAQRRTSGAKQSQSAWAGAPALFGTLLVLHRRRPPPSYWDSCP